MLNKQIAVAKNGIIKVSQFTGAIFQEFNFAEQNLKNRKNPLSYSYGV